MNNNDLLQLLQDNGYTKQDLLNYANAIADADRKAAIIAEDNEKLSYLGKCYKVDHTYYKVISRLGYYHREVSCLFFGEDPVLTLHLDYNGIRGEVILDSDSVIDVASVSLDKLLRGVEITLEEFNKAYDNYVNILKEIVWIED